MWCLGKISSKKERTWSDANERSAALSMRAVGRKRTASLPQKACLTTASTFEYYREETNASKTIQFSTIAKRRSTLLTDQYMCRNLVSEVVKGGLENEVVDIGSCRSHCKAGYCSTHAVTPDLSGSQGSLVISNSVDHTTRRASKPASLLSQDNATRASWSMLFSPGDYHQLG